VKSLQGSWREEHLFALKQAVNLYDLYQTAIAECEVQLTRVLGRLASHDDSPVPPRNTWRHSSTVEKDDLRKALCRTCGVDLTLIDGIDVTLGQGQGGSRYGA
jgi:transposase